MLWYGCLIWWNILMIIQKYEIIAILQELTNAIITKFESLKNP